MPVITESCASPCGCTIRRGTVCRSCNRSCNSRCTNTHMCHNRSDTAKTCDAQSSYNVLLNENNLLKIIIEEMEHKNAILKENGDLLKEKITSLESQMRRSTDNQKPTTSKSKDESHLSSDVSSDSYETTSLMLETESKANTSYSSVLNSTHRNSLSLDKEIRSSILATRVGQLSSSPNDERRNKNPKPETRSKGQATSLNQEVRNGKRIIGSNTTSELLGAAVGKRCWFCIKNLKPKTLPSQVKEHIRSKLGVTDIICHTLTSNEGYCSFKVGIREPYVDQLLEPSIWPVNVILRNFVQTNSRRRRTDQLVETSMSS